MKKKKPVLLPWWHEGSFGGKPDIRAKKLSTSDLQRIAGRAQSELAERAAEGDAEAARGTWNLAVYGTAEVERLVSQKNAVLTSLIESSEWCPAIFPASTKSQAQLVTKMKKRGLGKKCEINALGNCGWDTPVTHAASMVRLAFGNPVLQPGMMFGSIAGGPMTPEQNKQRVEWQIANAAKLPKQLTRANAPEWAALTLPLLEIFWGKEFEKHPDFAQYLNSAAYTGKNAKRPLPATQGKIRGEIRRQWRTSWSSMANPIVE